jgi:hypothetical protein
MVRLAQRNDEMTTGVWALPLKPWSSRRHEERPYASEVLGGPGSTVQCGYQGSPRGSIRMNSDTRLHPLP